MCMDLAISNDRWGPAGSACYARVMRLPGWVVDDATSVDDEVRGLRGTTAEERWRMALACAQDALWALSVCDHAERALAHEDALPESTLVALRRLRGEAGWGHGA